MKKHNLHDLLILRATFNKKLNDAIMSGNTEEVKSYIDSYDLDDRENTNMNEEINMELLKKDLEESNKEINTAIKNGKKVFGF